jgi:poly-gamma-glutamate capsule biosynthesis protein CapA/YwtB (metallophosphatase superfamily)
MEDLKTVNQELQDFQEENRRYEDENKKLNKFNNRLQNEKERMATEKTQAISEKNITKAGVNSLTREIEYLRKMTDQERTNIMNLIKDRNKMDRHIGQANDENSKK